MTKRFHFSALLLLSWCLSLAGWQPARAEAPQNAYFTYLNVGTNQYVITLHYYRNCSGAQGYPLNGQLFVLVRSSCNGNVAGTFPLSRVPTTQTTGSQYCAAQQSQAQCVVGAALPNFEVIEYRTATVTIPPGQWRLSDNLECCREQTANLTPFQTTYFRYESTLNNQIMVNGLPVTIQNSSAQFSLLNTAAPFVYYNQNTTLNFNASDPDNASGNFDQDSLVYSLVEPMATCTAFNAYSPYPGTMLVPGSTPPCYVVPPAVAPLTYSATLPIAVAYNLDPASACPLLRGTTPKFRFDAAAGQFTFTPGRYLNTAPVLGDNKYMVVGKVEEYRRLPGSNRRYLVGSVRREILVTVVNGVNNTGVNNVPNAPTAAAVTPGSGAVVISRHDSLEVTLQPCAYAQVLVRFTDPDPADLLSVVYTGLGTVSADALANGDIGTYQLLGDGTAHPVARFLFQPAPSYAGRVLYIPFTIQDNACPVRGLQTRVLVVHIAPKSNRATATVVPGPPGLGTTVASVCRGSAVDLRGASGRPDSARSRLQTYLYAWTGNGIVGSANAQVITVRPTATTRYRLVVNPASGFQTGVCADTASVLVRVVGPAVRLTASNPTVCAGLPVTLQASATPPSGFTDVYTYRFDAANGLAPTDLASANPSVSPTVTTRYRVTASGNPAFGCADTASVLVRVLPRVVGNFTTRDSVGLNGQHTTQPPVIFTFTNTSVITGPMTGAVTSYVWTYQRLRDAAGTAVNEPATVFGGSTATPTPLTLTVAGSYRIRLTPTVSIGGGGATATCTVAKERIVVVPELQIPNIITPNHDGLNDVFKVSTATTTSKLEIYNRWGRKIYEQSNYQNDWGAENQPSGVYYYLLTDRIGAHTKGWVEVVR